MANPFLDAASAAPPPSCADLGEDEPSSLVARPGTPQDSERFPQGDLTIEEEPNDVIPSFSGAIQGECTTMCPNDISELNRTRSFLFESTDKSRNDVDFPKAIKSYARSDAGKENSPGLIRTPKCLYATTRYLFENIVGQEGEVKTWKDSDRTHVVHYRDIYTFMTNRLRGVRNDFNIQHHVSLWSLRCLEWTARFHIMSGHLLCSVHPSSGFDPKDNRSMLDDSLIDALWKHYMVFRAKYYDKTTDRPSEGVPALRNLAEFAAYRLLHQELRQHDDHKRWKESTASSPDFRSTDADLKSIVCTFPEVLDKPEFKFAMRVLGAYASDNWPLYFKLLRKAPYLQACLMATVLPFIRTTIMSQLWRSHVKNEALQMEHLRDVLLFDDLCQTRQFLDTLSFRFQGVDEGDPLVEKLHLGNELLPKPEGEPCELRFPSQVVESRRKHRSHLAVCIGANDDWTSDELPVPLQPAPVRTRKAPPPPKPKPKPKLKQPPPLAETKPAEAAPSFSKPTDPFASTAPPPDPFAPAKATPVDPFAAKPAAAAADPFSTGKALTLTSNNPFSSGGDLPAADGANPFRILTGTAKPKDNPFEPTPPAQPAQPEPAPAGEEPEAKPPQPPVEQEKRRGESKDVVPSEHPPSAQPPTPSSAAAPDDVLGDDSIMELESEGHASLQPRADTPQTPSVPASLPPPRLSPPTPEAVELDTRPLQVLDESEGEERRAVTAQEVLARASLAQFAAEGRRRVEWLERLRAYHTSGISSSLVTNIKALRSSLHAEPSQADVDRTRQVSKASQVAMCKSLKALRQYRDIAPVLAAVVHERSIRPQDLKYRVLLLSPYPSVMGSLVSSELWVMLGGDPGSWYTRRCYVSAPPERNRVTMQLWQIGTPPNAYSSHAFPDVIVIGSVHPSYTEAAEYTIRVARRCLGAQMTRGCHRQTGIILFYCRTEANAEDGGKGKGALQRVLDAMAAQNGLSDSGIRIIGIDVAEEMSPQAVVSAWRAASTKRSPGAPGVPLTALISDASIIASGLSAGGRRTVLVESLEMATYPLTPIQAAAALVCHLADLYNSVVAAVEYILLHLDILELPPRHELQASLALIDAAWRGSGESMASLLPPVGAPAHDAARDLRLPECDVTYLIEGGEELCGLQALHHAARRRFEHVPHGCLLTTIAASHRLCRKNPSYQQVAAATAAMLSALVNDATSNTTTLLAVDPSKLPLVKDAVHAVLAEGFACSAGGGLLPFDDLRNPFHPLVAPPHPTASGTLVAESYAMEVDTPSTSTAYSEEMDPPQPQPLSLSTAPPAHPAAPPQPHRLEAKKENKPVLAKEVCEAAADLIAKASGSRLPPVVLEEERAVSATEAAGVNAVLALARGVPCIVDQPAAATDASLSEGFSSFCDAVEARISTGLRRARRPRTDDDFSKMDGLAKPPPTRLVKEA
eukprot:Sspe_Gene.69204::Locus_40792_Transcript_1_1_Confidence_1.000_Length_4462::g.69204::m.69204